MGKKSWRDLCGFKVQKRLMYMSALRKRFYHYLSFILLGGLVGLAGCKDNEELAPDDSIQVAATKSITVVFAPGQLGDMGYADNVMEGIYYLKMRDLVTESGACDVSFTMGESIDMTQEHLKTWFDSISNPRNNVAYEQRLLVEFSHRMRGERKFKTPAELAEQLQKDAAEVEKHFEEDNDEDR